jgi:hypothetical protein
MRSVIVEIRDRGTFISALAVQFGSEHEQERWLLATSGYGRTREDQERYVMLVKIQGGEPCAAHIHPFTWGQNPRTYFVAHQWIAEHFHELTPGCVVDVQFILGETAQPKTSDRFYKLEAR